MTTETFTGTVFTSDLSRGWDGICPPKLAPSHVSRTAGTLLDLDPRRGDISPVRVCVIGSRSGGSSGTIELDAEVIDAPVANFIPSGARVRITDANSWILLGGPCNVDPFGFTGTIKTV
jgi:hypothetical protein